jgi:hypothetical protein
MKGFRVGEVGVEAINGRLLDILSFEACFHLHNFSESVRLGTGEGGWEPIMQAMVILYF